MVAFNHKLASAFLTLCLLGDLARAQLNCSYLNDILIEGLEDKENVTITPITGEFISFKTSAIIISMFLGHYDPKI